MTQQKNNEPKKVKKCAGDPTQVKKLHAKKMPDLRQNFLSLPPEEQQKVTNFFNMHNCAVYLFGTMSEQAQEYTQYCISLSQEADKMEKKHE